MSEFFSRTVTSNQQGVHEDLESCVRKHLESPFQKPIETFNEEQFEVIQAARGRFRNKLILDSGCGTGESTVRLGKKHPDCLVVGVDKSYMRLYRAPTDLPENVQIIRGNLVDYWRLLESEQLRLHSHYIFYPNPWPKKKHLKRRWHGHPVFPTILRLGGMLELRSNWRLYLEEFQRALEIARGKRTHVEEVVPNEQNFVSPFERKYALSNQKLYSLHVDLRS